MSESFRTPSGKINWKSRVDSRCRAELLALHDAMKKFYATSQMYYKGTVFLSTWRPRDSQTNLIRMSMQSM